MPPDVADGRLALKSIQKAFILSVSQRQLDNSFRDALDNLCYGKTTDEDYRRFQGRFRLNVPLAEQTTFRDALHMYPTLAAVAKHNEDRLVGMNYPIALLTAKHNCAAAAAGSKDDAQGLEPKVLLCKSALITLRNNLWLQAGLVNGTKGVVQDIIYEPDKRPPDDLPAAVMVKFDGYTGPTLHGDTVPLVPVVRHWQDKNGVNCSREQIPARLAWASTVHSAQGLDVDAAVLDIGETDFTLGLTYVAMSRCKEWSGLLLDSEFPLERLTRSCRNSNAFEDRLAFEGWLVRLGRN